MAYEVELKFPLSDVGLVRSQLDELRTQSGSPLEQRDRYFAHPQRDFGETDEALRIRTVGRQNYVTYKGPVVDTLSKTRREIEVPLAEGAAAAEQFAEILTILGFREVRTVAKTRVPYRLTWEQREVEVVIDDVAQLGSFLEMELQSDEAGREAARDSLLRLADRLGLDNPERRSYLCLLLAQDAEA